MANENIHGLNVTAESSSLSCGLVKKENIYIHFDDPDETVTHSAPLKIENNSLVGIVKEENLDVKYKDITFQEENYSDSKENASSFRSSNNAHLWNLEAFKMVNVNINDLNIAAESDILSCGLVKKKNIDNHSDKSEEIVSHLPPLKNEVDHLFDIVKEEKIDVKHNDITFQEENYSDSKDNSHVIPLSFKMAKHCSTRKRMMEKINFWNGECYMCNTCSYKCSVLSNLKRHLRIHTDEKPYKCNSCFYKCSDLSNLKKHLRIHTGEKPYKCNSCSYESSRLSTLKNHLQIHTGVKPYKCNSCSYECSNRSYLKKHLRIHTGEKPYRCNYCSYECSERESLKRHLRIHTGEKPYKCNSCSYECSKCSNLKDHLKIHTGEKPFKCHSCSYECSVHSNLKRHLRIHTGEKPYKCNSCCYECSDRSKLKIHLRTHTGEKPYKCNSCSYESSELSNLKKKKNM